jgi:hypothetical protein
MAERGDRILSKSPRTSLYPPPSPLPPRKNLETRMTEAQMLIETAEQDGYVSEGWREDARSWLRQDD